MQSIKDELNYLQNKNLTKTSIIKSLTENQCFPPNITSTVFPPNLHYKKLQDEKHKSSTNKSCDSIYNQEQRESKNNQVLSSNNPPKKKTLILGYLIVRHVEDWRLNKGMKSTVTVGCILGTTANAMKHHLKGCLEDSSPDNTVLHHGANNLKSDNNSEKICVVVNLGLSVKK